MAKKCSLPLFPELKGKKEPCFKLERRYYEDGFSRVAGVDEVGRGPLAGPVVAAAVVLPANLGPRSPLYKVRDSKTLSPEQREEFYRMILERAEDAAWALCEPEEIDELNILEASLEAMLRAVKTLDPAPDLLLVDGNASINCHTPSVTVVNGDSLCLSIAAASIVAKVVRDRIMDELHKKFPDYGFDVHKGYGTAYHKKALLALGPSPVHRKSFRTVKDCLE